MSSKPVLASSGGTLTATDEFAAEHTPSMFEFITITQPGQIGDRAVQKKIHKHVMRDIGKSRRATDRAGVDVRSKPFSRIPVQQGSTNSLAEQLPAQETTTDFIGPQSSNRGRENVHLASILSSTPFELHSPNPATILGAGRVDPFAKFPTSANIRIHGLVDHIHDTTNPKFRQFRDVWFPLALADPGAFHQTLANSALHIGLLRQSAGTDKLEAVAHYATAVRSVNERLKDPVLGISDGIIGAVLAFMCHDYMVQNFGRWKVHMAGLKRIVGLRGDPHGRALSRELRLMIFWVDVTGSCALDEHPHFPIPKDLLPTLQPAHRLLSTGTTPSRKVTQLNRAAIIDAFDDLWYLTKALNEESANSAIWDDGMFVGLKVNPIIHKLLGLSRESHENAPDVVEEASRLAAVLFLGQIRLKFKCNPVIVGREEEKLKTTLSRNKIDWSPFPILLLWILVIGGTCSSKETDRRWYGSLIAEAIMSFGFEFWENVIVSLSDFLWIQEIFGSPSVILGDEVTEILIRAG